MSRKIKIQTVDKTNLTNLENALHENRDRKHVTISGPEKTIIVSDDTSYRSEEELKAELERDKQVKKEIRKELEQTKKIIEKLRNENVGDANADTNDDISITTNAHNIKRQYLIKKFKEIIFDIATDDSPVDMSLSDKINKKLRQGGCVIEQDFKLFLDIINNEVYNRNDYIPNEIISLITKIHGKNKKLHVLLCNQLAGYYNFLINELYIPIEDITENTYFVKLADNYIEIYNKLYFDVPEMDLNKLSETAGNNYKAINEKINEINNPQYEFKEYKECFNSEDSIRHMLEHYNLADSLIISKKTNKDSEKINHINDNNPLEENEQNRVSVTTDGDKNIIQNSKKYVEEHIIPRKKELERIEEATRNPLDVTKPYEEVNHPDHYNVYDVEVVEMMERIFGIEETMSWCKLNAFKYRMRAGEKPTSTVEKDLKKEKWCLNKYKELKSKK